MNRPTIVPLQILLPIVTRPAQLYKLHVTMLTVAMTIHPQDVIYARGGVQYSLPNVSQPIKFKYFTLKYNNTCWSYVRA
jgi:hypothetical protein